MLVLGVLVILMTLIINGSYCARLNDEFSVGTNLNKYLWSPKETEDDGAKMKLTLRGGGKRELWFGPRIGKRDQSIENENLPIEILEILEKVQKSPELQNILANKLHVDASTPYVVYIPNSQYHESLLMMPRLSRDAPDMSQNLNSRPYPPRFGRQFGGLPPYLPRLGRSSSDE